MLDNNCQDARAAKSTKPACEQLRPKDLEDIQTIVKKYPTMDVKRIEKWVKAFGEAMEMPDLWDLIKSLLK